MNQAKQIINSTELRHYAPLGKLSDEDAEELLRTSITVTLSPGTPVFSGIGNSNQVFYLIDGKIELSGNDKKIIIDSNSNEARKPIKRDPTGQSTARAVEESTLISFDTDMLDLFINWTNPNAYVVNEINSSEDNDWLNKLLKSRGLLRFTEQQINTLLDRMNEIHFDKGDVVVSQDDDDKFYYVIKNGRASVTRKPSVNSKEIKLAELNKGDAFGEESILTESNRSATITMEESGNLMRLSKQDFSELLAQPLLETISWIDAQALMGTGAELIDIRLEEEFNEFHIPDSRNIPLPLLRLKLNQFKQKNKYIIYCDDGSRSSVAAFLLNRNGIDAFILDGGMTSFINQMADSQIEKITNEPQETLTEPESTANEAHFCSLAEHWGDTVGEIEGEGFSDNDELYKVEKTTVTKGVKQNISTENYSIPTQKSAAVKTSSFQPKSIDQKKSSRNTIAAILVIALSAAAFYYLTNGSGSTNLSNTTQTPMQEKTFSPATNQFNTTDSSAIITPKTRFVPPATEASSDELTTERVGDADAYINDSGSSEVFIQEKTDPTIDPATRGFIE